MLSFLIHKKSAPIRSRSVWIKRDVEFLVDTAIMASGDILVDTFRIPEVCAEIGGATLLVAFAIRDYDDNAAAAMDLLLLNDIRSIAASNAAWNEADTFHTEAIVNVPSAQFIDAGGFKIGSMGPGSPTTAGSVNLPYPMVAVPGTRDVAGALVTRGTPTQTHRGLSGTFWFQVIERL